MCGIAFPPAGQKPRNPAKQRCEKGSNLFAFQVTILARLAPGADSERRHFLGGSMAINFVRAPEGSDDSIQFQPIERLKVYLFGATILFASFGMGEAVYRLLFSEFDGITDRIPIELLFGLVFAWLATKFVGGIYRNRKQRSARLNFIWARNHQIRGALEAINPLAHPSRNQQSIRVIREEVDRIESALKEILPG
ncbi:MAG TPA: hypothetical protein VMQ17_04845 [Candidatus Sulfotelmatobacter sp.]|nr:hypothetical protein [Candidatus Sulfotelmatobacter sp.]